MLIRNTPQHLELRRQCAKKVNTLISVYRAQLMKVVDGEWLLEEMKALRKQVNEIRSPHEVKELEWKLKDLIYRIMKKVRTNVWFREFIITNERVIFWRPGKDAVPTPPPNSWYGIMSQMDRKNQEELARKQKEREREEDGMILNSFDLWMWRKATGPAGSGKKRK